MKTDRRRLQVLLFFFFNDTATTEIYTLSLHDALPISLSGRPNALAPYYRRFRVADRLLLTGHSHQAWPDVGFEAQQRAWLDAAEYVDDKWQRVFAVAGRGQDGFARLLDDPDGAGALGANTHELGVRWLSALPLGRRPRLVTTTGEFHTIRRQLQRPREEGIAVVTVPP